MAEVYETKKLTERVVLVGVAFQEGDDTVSSLDELAELAATAGAVTVGRLIQNREAPHPGTYLGKGKIEELKQLIWEEDATGIICDDELSPAQLANLQDMLDTKVMDRTLIILDIFAQRASTREGKIQVELAQLRYRATRLTGLGQSLSRLGGGIGTRGPGEKKLEVDRRLIRDRISQLKQELEAVKRHREVARQQRSRSGSGGSHRGLYQCGEIHPAESAYGGGCSGGGQAVRHLGSDDPKFKTGQRSGDFADGYGWFYPKAPASSDTGLSEYAGGGKICRYHPSCGGCFKPADGCPYACCL